MQPMLIRSFISSTWLDLKPERSAVEVMMQRFRETKFIGMEYFGSRDETTRQISLAEVDKSDLYVCVVGGRYGSGITEDEYDRARKRNLPCMIYFKQEDVIPPEGRDKEPEKAKRLRQFKEKLQDPEHGHTVTEFSGPHELASRLACDLHNWLYERYLTPALHKVVSGRMPSDKAAELSDDLRQLAAMNRELLVQVAEEKRIVEQQRKLALQAFFQLTYIVPEALSRFPDTVQMRERVVQDNIDKLQELLKLSSGAHDVLRELATNYRLLASILMEQKKYPEAYDAYKKSAVFCASLILLQPDNDLYHRDLAVSHISAGYTLGLQGKHASAVVDYLESITHAERAAALNPRWLDLVADARRKAGL